MPPRSRLKTAPEGAGAKAGETAVVKPPEAPVLPPETTEETLDRMKQESRILLFRQRLAMPFLPAQVKFLPRNVSKDGTRCLAMPYIDARLVQDRLDEVVGPGGWSDAYEIVSNGSAVCKLTVQCVGRHEAEYVTKCDVGSPSDQPDKGDQLKAAFSDALKRAAVKFGIGRYLYRVPPVWCDYDPVKKKIATVPTLPAFAVPKAPVKDAPVYHDDEEDAGGRQTQAPPTAASPPPPPPSGNGKARTDQEVIDQQLAEWNKRLIACEAPEDLNALKPLIAKVPGPARKAVWTYILDSVCADPVNWAWDDAKKVFYDTAPVGDAIPF